MISDFTFPLFFHGTSIKHSRYDRTTEASAEVGGVEVVNRSAMGLDLTYALLGGDLGLAVSYNTASDDAMVEDMDMMSISAIL